MGVFTFKWPHAAEEVYVTGTFDNWSKSEKLEKVGDHFEKTVTLPETSESIFYKFVVDGDWTTDHEAPIAKDPEGNDNNLLKVEDIKKEEPPMAAVLNTVAPDSTTVGLASSVPLEPKQDAHATEKKETPADVPGTFPDTPAAEQDKQFSVNPLPATDFAVNPVELNAGEKVPKDLASNGINDHVTLDKASYEKSDRIPGLEGLTSPTDLAPTSIGTIIPESSLPMTSGDALMNSVAPQSSTAALAANVPLEHDKAPEVVKESQEKSADEVGSSGMEPVAGQKLDEKAKVETELLGKVPEAPSAAEGTSGKGTDTTEHTKSAVEHLAEGASAVGVSLVAAGLAAKDAIAHAAHTETAQDAAQQASTATANAKDSAIAGTQSAVESTKAAATNAAAQLPDSVKEALPASVQGAIPTPETQEQVMEKISSDVPVEVKESIAESGEGPEATANTAAVEQKTEVESELRSEVQPAESKPETLPTEPSSTAVEPKLLDGAKDPLASVDSKPDEGFKPSGDSKAAEAAPQVDLPTPPTVVPAVATPAPAADVKTEAPTEFPTEVTNGSDAAGPKAVEPPADAVDTPAKSEATGTPAKAAAPAASSTTPRSSKAADSPATAEKKKKNRLSSFFGKLKEKVAHKDKP